MRPVFRKILLLICLFTLTNASFADEKADKSLQAYVCCHNGEWFLINRNADGMLSPQGNPVPAGQAIRLTDGTVFRGSRNERGMLIKVRII